MLIQPLSFLLGSTRAQISSWVSRVFRPHKSVASCSLTSPLMMFSHTFLGDLPVTTMPSQPANLSWVEKRPPKLERVNQPIGYAWMPMP